MNKYIAKLLTKMSSLMEDYPGAWSSIRYVTVLVVTGVMLTWMILSFTKGQLLDIPTGVIVVLGIAVTGKVVQKGIEDKGNAS